ncbi:hypothetical protein PINS_up000130 [Pythium insidiosum]|nr:hypothetical protein PINS_up000130 [Pythium insidiosum]
MLSDVEHVVSVDLLESNMSSMSLSRRRARVLLPLLVVCLCLFTRALAFVVEVPGRTQECYYEYVRTKRTAFLKIGVLESQDQYDIRLKAYGPFPDPPGDDDVQMNFFDQMITTQARRRDQRRAAQRLQLRVGASRRVVQVLPRQHAQLVQRKVCRVLHQVRPLERRGARTRGRTGGLRQATAH